MEMVKLLWGFKLVQVYGFQNYYVVVLTVTNSHESYGNTQICLIEEVHSIKSLKHAKEFCLKQLVNFYVFAIVVCQHSWMMVTHWSLNVMRHNAKHDWLLYVSVIRTLGRSLAFPDLQYERDCPGLLLCCKSVLNVTKTVSENALKWLMLICLYSFWNGMTIPYHSVVIKAGKLCVMSAIVREKKCVCLVIGLLSQFPSVEDALTATVSPPSSFRPA